MKKYIRNSGYVRKIAGMLALSLVLFTGCEIRDSELYDNGMEALEKQDYVTSIAMFQGAIEAKERLSESYRCLGIAYLESGEYQKAAEAFSESLASMRHKNKEFTRDVRFYQARALAEGGNLDDALAVYETMLAKEQDAEVYFARGSLYLGQKSYEEAKADFDQAVKYAANYRMCLNIYQLYQECSMKADGDRYLNEAVKITPDGGEDYYELGCVYYYLEDSGNAASALNQAIEHDSTEAMALLGTIYLDQGKIDDARTLYQSCLSREGFEAAACNGMALCALEEGDTAGALAFINQGLEKAKGSIRENLLFNRIVAYERSMDFAAAKSLMSEFLEEYPENETAIRENEFLQSR